MLGAGGASVVAVLAIVSAVGSINGTMMASTRVYYAMAHDGLFFKALDYVHPIFRTPTRAIYAHCIWAAVLLVGRGSFESLAAGMVFAILIFYTLTAIALFRMRAKGTGDDIAYKMPFYPWLPAVYLVAVVGLLLFRIIFEFEKSLIDFAFVVSGLPVSFFWLRKGRRARATTV
jgi:APA family basic amino acid/polyamine antiporter